MKENSSKIHVGAVSYLNTVPLIWGMLHGPQREEVELSFSIPSACAEELEARKIDLGLVPVVEIARQELEIVPGLGIACLGAVRSILMFSRIPWRRVRTLAADLSSRTSIQLARIILRERFGVEPDIAAQEPNLEKMLAVSDAALIIGDPALRITPEKLPFEHLDLGAEWLILTGLPMMFAAWAGEPGIPVERLSTITHESYEFGRAHLAEIVAQECSRRGVTKELADQYLSHHIRFELGIPEQKGLHAFLELAGLAKRALAEPHVSKPA